MNLHSKISFLALSAICVPGCSPAVHAIVFTHLPLPSGATRGVVLPASGDGVDGEQAALISDEVGKALARTMPTMEWWGPAKTLAAIQAQPDAYALLTKSLEPGRKGTEMEELVARAVGSLDAQVIARVTVSARKYGKVENHGIEYFDTRSLMIELLTPSGGMIGGVLLAPAKDLGTPPVTLAKESHDVMVSVFRELMAGRRRH